MQEAASALAVDEIFDELATPEETGPLEILAASMAGAGAAGRSFP